MVEKKTGDTTSREIMIQVFDEEGSASMRKWFEGTSYVQF